MSSPTSSPERPALLPSLLSDFFFGIPHAHKRRRFSVCSLRQTLLPSTNGTNIMQQPEENNNNNNGSQSNQEAHSNSGTYTIQYNTTGNITGVPHSESFSFENQETAMVWFTELMALRNEQTKYRRQNVTSPQPGLAWLQRFDTFHNQWGSPFIPIDVRRSVHHTQHHLGVPLTQW